MYFNVYKLAFRLLNLVNIRVGRGGGGRGGKEGREEGRGEYGREEKVKEGEGR